LLVANSRNNKALAIKASQSVVSMEVRDCDSELHLRFNVASLRRLMGDSTHSIRLARHSMGVRVIRARGASVSMQVLYVPMAA